MGTDLFSTAVLCKTRDRFVFEEVYLQELFPVPKIDLARVLSPISGG
jgi:hypothetical protein